MKAPDARCDQELRDALAKHLAAQKELHRVIRIAYRKGWSLRRIAAVAGVSHEQVRRIVQP